MIPSENTYPPAAPTAQEDAAAPIWVHSRTGVAMEYSDGPLTEYQWEGTPGESVSIKTVQGQAVAHNYNPAGTFGHGIAGYNFPRAEVAIDTEVYGPTGGQSLRVTTDEDSIRNVHNGNLDVDRNNTTIRAQAWVRTAPDATGPGAMIRLGGAGVTASNSDEVLTNGQWQLLTVDTQLNPTGTVVLYLYAAELGTTWFDSVRLGEVDDEGIFDGDTPARGGWNEITDPAVQAASAHYAQVLLGE